MCTGFQISCKHWLLQYGKGLEYTLLPSVDDQVSDTLVSGKISFIFLTNDASCYVELMCRPSSFFSRELKPFLLPWLLPTVGTNPYLPHCFTMVAKNTTDCFDHIFTGHHTWEKLWSQQHSTFQRPNRNGCFVSINAHEKRGQLPSTNTKQNKLLNKYLHGLYTIGCNHTVNWLQTVNHLQTRTAICRLQSHHNFHIFNVYLFYH